MQDKSGERPKGRADLMGESSNAGLPVGRQAGKPVDQQASPENHRVRLEVRIPEDLSEALGDYVHEHRTSKAQAVTETLRRFLEGQGD